MKLKQKKNQKSIQFWPYEKAINNYYPGLSKLGKYLQIGTVICSLPYFINLAININITSKIMSPAKGAGWDGFAALRRPIFWALEFLMTKKNIKWYSIIAFSSF